MTLSFLLNMHDKGYEVQIFSIIFIGFSSLIAKEEFWTTGPIIATSAMNVPPGHVSLQWYLYFQDKHGRYNSTFGILAAEDTFSISPEFLIETGVTKWFDLKLDLNAHYSKKKSHQILEYGDTHLKGGFQLLRDGKDPFSCRIIVNETFPTGKYKHLDPYKGGIDATGSGSYETTFLLAASKTFYIKKHPLTTYLNLSYMFPTKVSVSGFHSYGGGYGCKGKVTPGNVFIVDGAFQYSFTKRWAFVNDIVYVYGSSYKFSGIDGTTLTGKEGTSSGGYSTQLSFAPGIEYSCSKQIGFIFGSWFTTHGHNSSEFKSFIFSALYYF